MLDNRAKCAKKTSLRTIAPYISPGDFLVDIGCGNPPLIINTFKDQMEHCFGLDTDVENHEFENVTLMKVNLKKSIPLPDESETVATMINVLDILDFPQAIVNETYRILKPGGLLLLTAPTPRNRPILELLAKLHVIRPKMIDQHKNYFTHADFREILSRAGFRTVNISSFQFGLNTFVRAIK